MLNEVNIVGVIQKGYRDYPAVNIRKAGEKFVCSFSIINKYGKDDSYSSGILKVEGWYDNESEVPIINSGDIVKISGVLKTNSYTNKDNVKVYTTLISSRKIDLVDFNTEDNDETPKHTLPFEDESKKESVSQSKAGLDYGMKPLNLPTPSHKPVKESDFSFDDEPVGEDEIPF